jgi:hypothetical protein
MRGADYRIVTNSDASDGDRASVEMDDEQRSRPRHQDCCTRPGFQQSVDVGPVVTPRVDPEV